MRTRALHGLARRVCRTVFHDGLPRLFNVEADVTLSLYADDRWLDVPRRIVRCTETNVEMAGAVWKRKEFETALSFHDGKALSSFFRS